MLNTKALKNLCKIYENAIWFKFFLSEHTFAELFVIYCIIYTAIKIIEIEEIY